MQIFATDLDRDAIEKACQGVFPANIAADVSPERLRRFFAKEEHGYRVRKEIREMVIITDNGKSFDVERVLHAKTNRRLGLLGMRERLEMVGGSLSVESSSGRGTTLEARVPFREQAGAGETPGGPAGAGL